MKIKEEIKARYWFLKGDKAGLIYAKNYANNDFCQEIKEIEYQISILRWILEEEGAEDV